MVFCRAESFLVAVAQGVLTFSIVLCSGFGVPLEGGGFVLAYSAPLLVAPSQTVLRFLVSFLCGCLELWYCLGIVYYLLTSHKATQVPFHIYYLTIY